MGKLHYVRRAYKARSKVEAKARKAAGIKPGDEFWWWKTRHKSNGSISGVKHYSKVKPRESQLTASAYKRAYWLACERIEDQRAAEWNTGLYIDLGALTSFIAKFNELRDAQLDGLFRIPNSLRDSRTHETMQKRADQCAHVISLIRDVIDEIESGSSTQSVSDILSSLVAAIPSPE